MVENIMKGILKGVLIFFAALIVGYFVMTEAFAQTQYVREDLSSLSVEQTRNEWNLADARASARPDYETNEYATFGEYMKLIVSKDQYVEECRKTYDADDCIELWWYSLPENQNAE